jgi:hypothetical protein
MAIIAEEMSYDQAVEWVDAAPRTSWGSIKKSPRRRAAIRAFHAGGIRAAVIAEWMGLCEGTINLDLPRSEKTIAREAARRAAIAKRKPAWRAEAIRFLSAVARPRFVPIDHFAAVHSPESEFLAIRREWSA